MLIRIVKMIFDPEKTAQFQELFHENRHRINGFAGCHSVELLQDIKHGNIFFTYSHWESEEALEAYRRSETFMEIWGKTKPMFIEKAEAWSVKSAEKKSS